MTIKQRQTVQERSILGGEEERGILGNFPDDKQTSETALLFLQWWGEGAYERQTIDGAATAAKVLSLVRENDLIINKAC